MAIQKTNLLIQNKNYEIILEDGVVSYIDSQKPELRKTAIQARGQKITSMETAKRVVVQSVTRVLIPDMRFSD